MYKRKTKAVFFANRTAKIRTLFIILQNFSEVFLKESAKTLKDNDVVEHIFSTVEKGA